MYVRLWKRVLDVVLSAVLLVLLLPLFLGIMLCLAFTPSGRVFFTQSRVGRDGRLFSIVKFCTMDPRAPHNVATRDLPDPERWITPIGRILRRTSLDELPQLWNVLKGEMSFIGPRPIIPEETELHRLRRENGAESVRPGLTGWAQVNGRDALDNERKAAYDAAYARDVSPSLDIRIAFVTLRCLFIEEEFSFEKRKKEPPQPMHGA